MALSTGKISLGDVNTLGSPLFSGPTALGSREQQAMGNSSPARVTVSRVCMPNEIINENTGALAKDAPGQGSTARSPNAWSYTGGTRQWAPHRLSEFHGAYNNLPYANVTASGTGATGSGNFLISIGGELSYLQSFYMVDPGGGTSWTGLAPGATATVPVVDGTHYIYVKDYYNCGTAEDIVQARAYPY